MSRLRALLRRLGAPGVIGVGVLFFCIPMYFSALLPAERELAAQREAAQRSRARGPLQPVALDPREADLRRFYALFPPVDRMPAELERLYALARRSQLELAQGEYRVEKRSTGLISYRVALPVRGTYAQVRSFVRAVLTEMPVASLDALRFERRKAADAQLEAQVRLTVHFRPSGESP